MGSLRRGLTRYNISDVTGGINVGDFGGNLTGRGFEDRYDEIYRAQATRYFGRYFLGGALFGIGDWFADSLLEDTPTRAIDGA